MSAIEVESRGKGFWWASYRIDSAKEIRLVANGKVVGLASTPGRPMRLECGALVRSQRKPSVFVEAR